ncbi:ComGF family competence protein [Sporolactobacillus sp. THM19-2]|jgi:competence protein ComGF|uniref:ComGF family competence protein n=1 Tax=Sporolactobacillus sp. THM19-2 TaxID=2511171 RepID=UPI001020124A|nr:ComGF family competence protein [Sporolactobacillus sp. THM19-2]RYL90436.1 competence protein ComGF [Sporolactobacillus sp. THM19-2]
MKKQDGFTLLSTLLGLSIFSIVLLLVTCAAGILASRFQDDVGLRKEITIFLSQTALELHQSNAISCSDGNRTLIILKDDQEITYKLDSKGRLVRSVDDRGYEIVLQRIKSVRFDTDGRYLFIHLVDQQHRSYFLVDSTYLGKEAVNHSFD